MRTQRWLVGLMMPIFVIACSSDGGSDAAPGSASSGADAASCDPATTDDGGTTVEPDDQLSPLRLLRRASIVLLGAPPTDDDQEKLLAATTRDAQLAFVDSFVDTALKDARFYDTMFETARSWFNIPAVPLTADAPEYGPKQQRCLMACAAGTLHAGRAAYTDETGACNDPNAAATTVEPWWAPGTQINLSGRAANTSNQGTSFPQGSPVPISCNGRAEGTCGCGPNAESCWLETGPYSGQTPFILGNPDGQRRLLSEEPARLFAHLAWYDKPATDLILGDTSVGPTEAQAAYVMQGIVGGAVALASDDSWWRPSKFSSAVTDPHHQPGDPKAWREYQVSKRNPLFLAERDYKFDPRKDKGPSRGFPSAGVLTSIGFLGAYPRERIRAARALETFACEQLLPPAAGVKFNAYVSDPGREGPCQNCHTRIDPAAIHFKRYSKQGWGQNGWGATYVVPNTSAWKFPAEWPTYSGDPFGQWNKWYKPGTLMTPVTHDEATANPLAIFIDYLPSDITLLGQTSDGTVGPLGFAKLIVASGEFDQCVVRHMHERIMGRDIDPAAESGYLTNLTTSFVTNGRHVRALVKALTRSDSFRRGI
jgi:hypothetical protein